MFGLESIVNGNMASLVLILGLLTLLGLVFTFLNDLTKDKDGKSFL
jgi:hypothetical protein